jgi:hypothetical protein
MFGQRRDLGMKKLVVTLINFRFNPISTKPGRSACRRSRGNRAGPDLRSHRKS